MRRKEKKTTTDKGGDQYKTKREENGKKIKRKR